MGENPMEGMGFPLDPNDMPPEVRAWLEEQARQAMAIFGALHGKAEVTSGFIVDALNTIAWDEDELTDEKVEEDHDHAKHMMEYVKVLLPTPQDWGGLTDADKIRVVVADHYMRMSESGQGVCVHRDMVERELLEIADTLDLMQGFGAVPPDQRVAALLKPGECGHAWEGKRNETHFLGSHWCKRKASHPGRCRCGCGVSTTQFTVGDG